MTRRTWLWALGLASLVVGLVLAGIDDRLWDEGGPGIIGFELAGSEESSREILVEWGEDGRDAARLSLYLDYLYLVLYGAFLALAASATRDHAAAVGWRRFAAAGPFIIGAAIAGAACDAIEDGFLLLALEEHGGDAAPLLGAVFATAKFLLLAIVIGYVLFALVRRAWRRWPRAAPAALGAAIVLGLAALVVNAIVLENETASAKAEAGGRVLDLPEGDIHVRSEGDPADPPIVLIHGFAISMRWWDRTAPLLAREHNVIRVDLLGHGGSEKPGEGYAMEDQADHVAAALERLGVRRAAVVGHSMGAIVATALAERHRPLVERIVTISGPPDRDSLQSAGAEVVTSWPLVGHAINRALPDRILRNAVEQTSPPQYDVPERLWRDVKRTTWTSFSDSGKGVDDYLDERSLPDRLAPTGVALTAVAGSEDSSVDPDALSDWRAVPRARLIRLGGLGHNPHVEDPARTAREVFGAPARTR